MNSVVDISSSVLAVSRGVYSGLVVSEVSYYLVSDGNWTNISDDLLHGVLISFSDVESSEVRSYNDVFVIETLLILSMVLILLLSLKSIVVDIGEGMRWKSTTASVVVEVSRAIDKLLLSE